MQRAYIPYGQYWSTPFARWQGSLAHLHALEFAAWNSRNELQRRGLQDAGIDHGVLGTTVPQQGCFYGLPWVTGMMGLEGVGGPTVAQACATSARCLAMAADEVAMGRAACAFVLTADRISNGPQLYYPDPAGPGGAGRHESWVMDNFREDPFAKVAMVETAENVARRYGIGTAEQNEVTLQRYEQYAEALADDHAFQRRYMRLPFEVPDARLRKTVSSLASDEGIHATSRAGLEKLKPVTPGGTVTYGGQTHPADGHAALFVTTREKARELSAQPEIEVKLLGFGMARVEKAHMPMAPVPAAQAALKQAGVGISEVAAVKTHNPFAVNDIVFSREMRFPLEKMNRFGCSLVWGHPQGPTGLRSVIELVEELALRGGGTGLFTGCAAGDTAMAVVLRVDGAR
ncbi:MAG TPA: thiolase family protein [Ramlibacter sp.]|nr:thiolase family protein [Ramlibacter sp.]